MATRTVGTGEARPISKNPKSVMWVVMELINDLVALANEMRTDHAATKVTVDQLETLAEELGTDHGTYKVTVDGLVTAVDELIDDHATFKTDVDETNTWATEVADDDNNLSNHLDFLLTPNGVYGGSYYFTAGGAVTLTAAGYVDYQIGSIRYHASLPATITLEDLGDIAQNYYGAWRIEIDRLGACTAKLCALVGGYSTEQKALLSLSALAPTANAATLGYLTVVKTASAFNIGTDNLTVATATATIYYERGPRKRVSGLNAALGAASALVSASTTYGHGTIDANMNGLKKAQIGAGAAQALTDADIISTTKYGAVVICTDLAGTSTVSLNAAGLPAVQTMAYADAATAKAAIDLVVDRLPSMFVPFALIRVYNGTVGDFTFKTTAWNTALVTATITDATVAGWDRTKPTGFDSHQISRVAIPALVAATTPAAAPATLTAQKPTAGPATLTASIAITSGPATLSAAAVDDISTHELGAP
jgi:hypothetical protein